MNDMHPVLTEHYDGMNKALKERDELLEMCKNQAINLGTQEQLLIHYKEELTRISQERDYYYRKAYAYTNTLVAMRNHTQAMLDLADHEAENGDKVLLPKVANIQEVGQ